MQRIQARGMATNVPEYAECASICFMVFAAGRQRIASASARIGVHSASLNGEETTGSLGVSTIIARMCSTMNVPPAILGLMVTTPANDVAWLSVADLQSMQVDVIQ